MAAAARPEPAPLKKIGNLRMVWRRMLRYPGRLTLAAVSLLTAASATLAIPDGFRRIIDRGFGGHGGHIESQFNYLFMIVGVLALATALRFYFVSLLGERVVADLRAEVHGNMLRLEPRFFEENRPSEIASRITTDTAVIETVVGSTVSVALRNLVLGVGGIIYLFALSPAMGGSLIVGLPLIIVPLVVLGRRVRSLSRKTQDRIAEAAKITVSCGTRPMRARTAAGSASRRSTPSRRTVPVCGS